MIEWKILKVEVKFVPSLFLAVGFIDRSLVLALAGMVVKVGRK
ncbi:MAG: hypothetical protein ACOYB2_03010 [Limnohabitans sp.]